jgi:glutamyl-tRNA synthetase
MKKEVRVRFAPSPTGPLHIGGVRTALFNYLFAKKNNGTFILRIEDTDQTRYVPGAEEYIVESLKWTGINIDEGFTVGGPYGPYRQSERKDIYRQYAEQLVENGYAYYAFDTPEELDEMRERLKKSGVAAPQYNSVTRSYMKNSLTLPKEEVKARIESGDPYVIRLKVPRNEEIKIYDIIRKWVVVNSSKIDDKILLKADGMPTYHLANVVDDHLMKISHVIRGEEWLPSTPLHVLLYKYLGWEEDMPEFAHLPLILRPNGNGKLSKRDGDLLGFPVYPLEWKDPKTGEVYMGYREAGYFPEAFINILVFLGWNPGTNQEFFTMEELIKEFSLERVGKAGSKFDVDKARWFNHQYLMKKSNKELAKLFLPEIEKRGYSIDLNKLEKIVGFVKERAHFITEFWNHAYYFFEAPKEYEEKSKRKFWNSDGKKHLEAILKILVENKDKTISDIENTIKSYITENGYSFGKVLNALRLALTGVSKGPSLFEIIDLIGVDEAIKRVEKALSLIEV